MINLVDALNLLKQHLDTEITLRDAANVEFEQGNRNGPMLAAHTVAITNVIAAAKNLVQLAGQ